jgi:hypothetical protein
MQEAESGEWRLPSILADTAFSWSRATSPERARTVSIGS